MVPFRMELPIPPFEVVPLGAVPYPSEEDIVAMSNERRLRGESSALTDVWLADQIWVQWWGGRELGFQVRFPAFS